MYRLQEINPLGDMGTRRLYGVDTDKQGERPGTENATLSLLYRQHPVDNAHYKRHIVHTFSHQGEGYDPYPARLSLKYASHPHPPPERLT